MMFDFFGPYGPFLGPLLDGMAKAIAFRVYMIEFQSVFNVNCLF